MSRSHCRTANHLTFRLGSCIGVAIIVLSISAIEASVKQPKPFEPDPLEHKLEIPDSLTESSCFASQHRRSKELVLSGNPVTSLDSAVLSLYSEDGKKTLYVERFLLESTDTIDRAFARQLQSGILAKMAIEAEWSLDSIESRRLAKLGLEANDRVIVDCISDPVVYLLRAYLCELLADTLGTAVSLRKINELVPNSVYFNKVTADFYYRIGKYEQADSTLAKLKEQSELGMPGLERWAKVKYWLDQNRECIAICDQVLNNDPTNFIAKKYKGRAYYQLDEYEKAIPFLTYLVRIDTTDYWSWYQLGHSFRMINQLDESIQVLHRCLNLDPSNSFCYIDLARCFQDKGDPAKAVFYADSATMLSPESSENHWLLGWLLLVTKRYEESIVSYTTALKYDHENAQIWFELSCSFFEANRRNEMYAAIDSVLKYDPKHAKALRFTARELRIAGKHLEAVKFYCRLVSVTKRSADDWAEKSLTEYLAKQYEESLKSCNEALRIAPNRTDLRNQKHEILLKLGRKE